MAEAELSLIAMSAPSPAFPALSIDPRLVRVRVKVRDGRAI